MLETYNVPTQTKKRVGYKNKTKIASALIIKEAPGKVYKKHHPANNKLKTLLMP
jgi:hypothetical protein